MACSSAIPGTIVNQSFQIAFREQKTIPDCSAPESIIIAGASASAGKVIAWMGIAMSRRSPIGVAVSEINEATVRQLHRCESIDAAHNMVLVGGPGTGKTHVATAPGIQAIEHHRRKVRFFSTTRRARSQGPWSAST